MRNKGAEEGKTNGLSRNAILFLYFKNRTAHDKYRRTKFLDWNYQDIKNIRNSYKEIMEELGLTEYYEEIDSALDWELLEEVGK